MSEYEYAKNNGDVLRVCHFLEGKVLVKVEHKTGHAAGMTVHADDAPAVALAILTESGVKARKYTPGSDVTAQVAREAAAGWAQVAIDLAEQEAAERAEREAEDTKVREFWRAVKPGSYCGDGPVRDEDRAGYHAAREFFTRDEGGVSTEDLAEALGHKLPRVLQHGDPEPDHSTAWVDRDGDTWKHGEDPDDGHLGWRWIDRGGEIFSARDWSRIGSRMFPLTEVTE